MKSSNVRDSPLKNAIGITFRKPVSENRHKSSPTASRLNVGTVPSISTEKSPFKESAENPRTPADFKGKGISAKRGVNFSLSPEPRAIERQEERWLQQALFESAEKPVPSSEKRSALTDVSNSPLRKRQKIVNTDKKEDQKAAIILPEISTPVKPPVKVFRDDRIQTEEIQPIKEENDDAITSATVTATSEPALVEDPFSLDTLTANLLITEIVDVNAKEAGIRKLGTGTTTSATSATSRDRSRRGIARVRGRRGRRDQEKRDEENKETTPEKIPEKASAKILRRRKRDVEIYQVLSPPQLHSSSDEQNKKSQPEIDEVSDDEENVFEKQNPVDNNTTKSIPQTKLSKKVKNRIVQPESLLPIRHFVNPSMTEMMKRKRYREQVQNQDVSFTQQMRDADDYIASEIVLIDTETNDKSIEQKSSEANKAVGKMQSKHPSVVNCRKSYSRRSLQSYPETLDGSDDQKSSISSSRNDSSTSPESVYSMGEAYTDYDSTPRQLPLSHALKRLPTEKEREEKRKRAETFAALREKFAQIDKWKLRVDSVDVSPDDASFSGYATVTKSSSESSQQSSPAQSLGSSPPSEAAEEQNVSITKETPKDNSHKSASPQIISTPPVLRRTRQSSSQEEFSEHDIELIDDVTFEYSDYESLEDLGKMYSSSEGDIQKELDKRISSRSESLEKPTTSRTNSVLLTKSTTLEQTTTLEKSTTVLNKPETPRIKSKKKTKSSPKDTISFISTPKSPSNDKLKTTEIPRRRTRSTIKNLNTLSASEDEIELLE
ncbi:uncharacterized protein SAPINGB_P001267 [Magnusiomyces paraingens]|uniref:Uncharacterized protein n=1 Tax=Magnusiomyces paraingens TaxID=2606893 RepID=A0A5E8B5F1_9ASCO|nr:uncharacterized protein SAPINGB_P001267 [Saprochaete ingens]VVT46546.1 unnamed protein product [Saprochaete ingens]